MIPTTNLVLLYKEEKKEKKRKEKKMRIGKNTLTFQMLNKIPSSLPCLIQT